jgi:hypothetical protein
VGDGVGHGNGGNGRRALEEVHYAGTRAAFTDDWGNRLVLDLADAALG